MTLVKGDLKASFSIATTHQGVEEGDTPFPGLIHFTLDPCLLILSAKQGSIKYHFLSLGMTQPEIEPRSPGTLANTILIRPKTKMVSHKRRHETDDMCRNYETCRQSR